MSIQSLEFQRKIEKIAALRHTMFFDNYHWLAYEVDGQITLEIHEISYNENGVMSYSEKPIDFDSDETGHDKF